MSESPSSADRSRSQGVRLSVQQICVYSRPGCHLCEDLLEVLLPLVRDRADVEVRNVDERQEWKAAYGERIPVVEVDGRLVCQYRLDIGALSRALSLPTDSMAAS